MGVRDDRQHHHQCSVRSTIVKTIRDDMVSPKYQLQMFVGMNHQPTIGRLKDIFQCGSIWLKHGVAENHNDTYVWNVTSKNAIVVLSEMEPYLVTKKAHSEVAIAFQNTMTLFGKVNRRTPQSTIDLREGYFQELKKLNKRGKDIHADSH